MRYLNRLSDLLFVLARVLARADGHGEVLWQTRTPQSLSMTATFAFAVRAPAPAIAPPQEA